MTTKTDAMDRRKAPWRQLERIRKRLLQLREAAKASAERAGDDRGGLDRSWWQGFAGGMGDAERELRQFMDTKGAKR